MLGHTLSFNRVVLGACALAMLLAGCGRKGALEAPPGTPQTNLSAVQQERVLQDTDTPGLLQSPNQVYERSAVAKLNSASSTPPPRPINAPAAAQPSTFFLDPLVK